MANVDRPRGLVPIRHSNGSPYNGACELMYIQAAYGTALFIGDPVIPGGSGSTASASGEAGVGDINAAGASGIPIGVIVGFKPNPSDLTKTHSIASTEGYAYVCTAPDVIYGIQDDGNTAMDQDDIGLNADFIAGAGDATTGRSGYELDSGGTTAPATTNTLALRILGLVQKPDNTLGEVNAEWEVRINTHQNSATLGV